MSTTTVTPAPLIRGTLLARNAVLNLLALCTPLVLAVVAVPLLIRGLGAERFGVLALVWMFLTYLAELGFGSATTRYAAEALGAGRTGAVGALAWTTAALQAALGCIEGIALAALTPWLVNSVLNIPPTLVGEASTCFYMLAAALPFLSLARSFRSLLEATQRFGLALAVQAPITICTYLVAAIGAVSGWSLPWVFATILVSRLIALPAYFAVAQRALSGVSLRPAITREKLRELTTFAIWAAITTIVSPLLLNIDRFVIGALLTMSALAFYAAPYELIARLTLIPGAIVGALLPAFSQLSASQHRTQVASIAARAMSMILVFLAPLVIVVVGAARDGLTVWLGPEYAINSSSALQILAVGVLINAAAHVPYALLHSIARPDIPARFHLIELPLQVVLAWVLVSRFGVAGAAVAWSARMIIDAVLLFIAATRAGVLPGAVLAEHRLPLTMAIIAAAGTATALASTLPSPLTRLSATLAIATVTTAVLWRTAVAAPDRSRLAAVFRPVT